MLECLGHWDCRGMMAQYLGKLRNVHVQGACERREHRDQGR
jgi:hypothetical protein